MESKIPKTQIVRKVFGRYLHEAVRYPFLLAGVILCQIGVQVTGLVSPLYLRQIFNALATQNTDAALIHQVLVAVWIIGTLYLLQWLLSRVQAYSNIALEPRVMANLYLSAFGYLIRHSYHFFTSQFAGTLTRRVSKYADAFERVFDAIMESFFPTVVYVIGAVFILFFHNHVLGIILGVWSVCFVTVQIFLSRLHRPLRVFRSQQDSKVVGMLADAIGNQNTIALFSGAQHEEERFAATVEMWMKARFRAWTFMANIWGVQSLLMVGINVALLYGAVIFWQRHELTIGDFVLIQTYLVGTFGLLNSVTQQLRGFYDAFADAEEMVEILEQPHGISDRVDARKIAVGDAKIDFSDVGFYFRSEKPVLSGFTLSIPGRQKVALVGPSGAGKTTITKLVLRLYDVTSGSIKIDGQDIAEVTQESLRDAIAFVPQEPILFHRSLMENIRYGKRDATDAEVFAAARKAHCHEFIQALPEGYETFVGERGVKLSGGERQRVAIARAILKDAPILVLDEATSSLDSESESLIQDSLRILMEGKTVLVIAHRLSTIMNMDRIVVLEGGAVVADGTHDELLERGGLYKKLWSIQAGGFIADEEDLQQTQRAKESEEEQAAHE